MGTPVLNAFRPFVHLGAKLYWRIRLEGIQHIPADGPLIIAPNHVTFADPVLVCLPIRFPVHFMAWDALFEIPGFAWLIRRLRAFPVQIESADPRSAREAVRLLQAGRAVMIFPEAGRTLDGRLQRFRPGAFRLACSLKVPVLPVTIVGGHASWPPGRVLPRPGRLRIIYHPVLPPPDVADTRVAARMLAEQVRDAIATGLPDTEQPAAGA
ncbi:MAG TPA: lysophospholipid acyltransferase family protein [Candidatus Bathyarchaeia archaeon]|nr:lysophospholipid acyltransferase family protein [Candidatus Bathyarchaeia archaeon]